MTLKQQLIGDLVGLARATDGNEHLRSNAATELIRRVLITPESTITDSVFVELNLEILEQKRNMVPDCFHCASPCGRTAAYDLDSIENLPANQKIFRHRILTDLVNLANLQDISEPLYQGLVLLGMDDCPSEHQEYWHQIIDKTYRCADIFLQI